jgi:hypothetical protein
MAQNTDPRSIVPADPPPALTERLDRITAPEERDPQVPVDVTGALARLLGWWLSISDGAPLAPADVRAGADHIGPGVDPVEAGIRAADRAIDAGATLLVPAVTAPDPVAARALVALLARKDASAVTAQPPGMSDRAWMDVCAAVRDRSADLSDLRGEPLALLGALAADEIAFVVGVLLGASARRTACLVDGTDALAAALVADRLAFRAKGWWLAASDSPDPGRTAAVDRIELAVCLPLSTSDDAGRAAQAVIAQLALLTRP